MKELAIIPTKYQSVFSGLYERLSSLLWLFAISIAAWFVFSIEIASTSFLIPFLFFSISYVIFFLFFYKGASRRIIFNEEGFEFCSYENKRFVKWSEYQGYKITKFIPHQVKIKIQDRESIVFGFYAFSSEQRKKLFSILDAGEF
ncbi:hypothetical protein ISG33_14280 [Glaciecola sp. MH2013]|uniref:hypothetical protein n=1 Tax=Glaciecola sp. MH2013 TaxID=2785524 RepID=UPI0018A08AC0|nr:hypothetical protein [Glaciecola sp. MH2013]MBF7074569.1 hypothetical protein [Glaciecola sp. MH2013]